MYSIPEDVTPGSLAEFIKKWFSPGKKQLNSVFIALIIKLCYLP